MVHAIGFFDASQNLNIGSQFRINASKNHLSSSQGGMNSSPNNATDSTDQDRKNKENNGKSSASSLSVPYLPDKVRTSSSHELWKGDGRREETGLGRASYNKSGNGRRISDGGNFMRLYLTLIRSGTMQTILPDPWSAILELGAIGQANTCPEICYNLSRSRTDRQPSTSSNCAILVRTRRSCYRASWNSPLRKVLKRCLQ